MLTKLEDFYDRKLYELLQDAIKERDGWAQDRVYQLICGAAQIRTPHEQIPETGSDIMKLREVPIGFPSITPPAQLAQYYRNTDGDHGSVPNQADILYQDLCRSFNQNFKEYVFTDREHGISIRINFHKEKK